MATTPVALFRVGNQDARLDRVRCKDVAIFSDAGETKICARAQSPLNTAGISCWDSAHRPTALRGRIWELPANSIFDETKLLLWETRPGSGHWQWAPATDMRGSVFIAALRAVNAQFR